MPRFEPFPAWRYRLAAPGPGDARSVPAGTTLDDLLAPPYDVLSEAEVAALKARSDHNIAWLDDPRGGAEKYREAGELLRHWCSSGVLVRDAEPTFSVYRISFTDATGARREISGVLGGLELLDPGTRSDSGGRVLPHERTTPKDSSDRLELTRATSTNLSPIWGLSLASGLTRLLEQPGELVGRVVDDAGNSGVEDRVEHRVERISDPQRIGAIRDLIASDDVLIADGHHRYQVGREYRDDVRAGRTDGPGPADYTLAFVNELVADQLSVEAIHRLYSGVDTSTLLAGLDTRFTRSPLEGLGSATLAAMQADGFLVLVTADGAEQLRPRPGVFDGVRALDGLWLEQTLTGPAFESLQVTYQHGLAQAAGAVRRGEGAAAVLIRPVGVAEIERTAREGVLMPPKSTFFTPKLKTGFVLRSLGIEPGPSARDS